MKNFILSFFALGCFAAPLFSQITVNSADMPAVGDTLRVSLTNIVPGDYEKTAMDTTWNYASLEALSQRVDTFANVNATPLAYQYFFVLLGGANIAQPLSNAPLPGLPISQGFTFYKNSAGSYSDLGSAYTIQGLPLPAKYDIPDKQYQFPMSPGTTWSSVSSFSIDVPDFAYYSTQRNRTSIVDGWGELTTPYGTFQTLRVKSTLILHDSIYIDSLGLGFPFNRNVIEYKWLANGKGIPVLQVTEEGSIVTAVYRDLYRMAAQNLTVTLGPDTAVPMGTVLTIHATVTGGTPPYQILWNTTDTGNVITVTVQDIQTYSVLVVDALQSFGFAQKVVSVSYPPGFNEYGPSGVPVYPNPSRGEVRMKLPERATRGVLQVFSSQGNEMRKLNVDVTNGELAADLSDLPQGLYLLRITTATTTYSAKLRMER